MGCAEAALRVVTGGGQIVVVTFGKEDLRLAGFQKTLKRHPQILLTPHFLTPDPKDAAVCPPVMLREVLQQYPIAAVIVFFLELPAWNLAQHCFTAEAGPKLIALTHRAALSHHGGYFQQGRLLTLITARQTLDDSVPTNPKTPAEWFARDYEIVTPDNYTTRLSNPVYLMP
ncbi:MAG: hypothetical protein PCFJNLEI_02640 [Verrucomicrobiae bacterium]|nr:hypothetical protein [Verrucomicrobiae bacterium]